MSGIDWPAVIADIAWRLGEPSFAFPEARRPAGSRIVAKHLGVRRSTLVGWSEGAEPKHSDGEAILSEWIKLTGKQRAEAPIAKMSLSASEVS